MPEQPERPRVRTESCPKRVRAYANGIVIADTTRALYVWEVPYYPAYYVPAADVRTDLFSPSATTKHWPSRGEARFLTLDAGDGPRRDAAWHFPDSPVDELRDRIRLDWQAMDAWFEEDEEVYVHPRDPYTRVDILATSRHVVVELDGIVLADTTNARVLFETGLPPRWYIPKPDVRMELLRPTTSATSCPYKGTAEYWSATVAGREVADLAWSYRTPLPESQKIAGMIAFYNERVDLVIDGERPARPETKFS